MAKALFDRRVLMAAALGALGARAAAAAPSAAASPAQAESARVRRGYCDGPFGQIHYRTAGEGDPLILCHGSGWTSHAYEAVLPQFAAAGYRALAFDTPGAGLSDAAPGEPSVADLSTAIDAVQAHLRGRRVFLAGHHTGGNMSSVFAGRRPQAVRALAISGPEAGFHYTNYRETYPPPATADGAHVMKIWAALYRYLGGFLDPEAITRNTGYELIARRTSWQQSFATGRFDAAAAYTMIRSPTLVLCGRAEGVFAYMEPTRRLRPDFSFAELPGHGLDENPSAWAAQVIGFFDAHR